MPLRVEGPLPLGPRLGSDSELIEAEVRPGNLATEWELGNQGPASPDPYLALAGDQRVAVASSPYMHLFDPHPAHSVVKFPVSISLSFRPVVPSPSQSVSAPGRGGCSPAPDIYASSWRQRPTHVELRPAALPPSQSGGLSAQCSYSLLTIRRPRWFARDRTQS
jgi:hypothetical protein